MKRHAKIVRKRKRLSREKNKNFVAEMVEENKLRINVTIIMKTI